MILWYHKQRILKKIKEGKMTKTEYDKLKKEGHLFNMFPKATGDYDKDCDYIFLKQIKEANQRFVDPYETVTHNED